MRLKDYRRRRKRYLTGGNVDPKPKPPVRPAPNWYVDPKGSASRYIGSQKLLGQGSGTSIGRPNAGVGNALNTITKNSLSRAMIGPATIGIPAGIAIGEAVTGESLMDSFGDMRSAQKGRGQAIANRKKADAQLAKDKGRYDNISEDNLVESGTVSESVDDTPTMMQGVEGWKVSPNTPKTSGANEPSEATQVSEPAKKEATSSNRFKDAPRIGRADAPDSVGVSSGLEFGDSKVTTAGEESAKGGSNTNFGELAMQFLPDIVNLGTGILGKDSTKPATKISRRSTEDMPSRFNVNPQLDANNASYRAILSDPNATMNQKLAALNAKQTADSKIYAEKHNQENRMRSDKAQIEANLDSHQARYDESHRQDSMASEANLGLDGNFARQALANISNKGLQMMGQKNAEKQNNKALATMLAGVDPAVQERILKALEDAE